MNTNKTKGSKATSAKPTVKVGAKVPKKKMTIDERCEYAFDRFERIVGSMDEYEAEVSVLRDALYKELIQTKEEIDDYIDAIKDA